MYSNSKSHWAFTELGWLTSSTQTRIYLCSCCPPEPEGWALTWLQPTWSFFTISTATHTMTNRQRAAATGWDKPSKKHCTCLSHGSLFCSFNSIWVCLSRLRTVKVIKLISKDSIEDAMLRIGERKLKLEQDMTATATEEGENSLMKLEGIFTFVFCFL